MNNDIEHPSIKPETFFGYFPNMFLPREREFRAIADLNYHCVEAHEVMHERVRRWTLKKGLILGEGVVREVPLGLVLLAPVINREDYPELFYEHIDTAEL